MKKALIVGGCGFIGHKVAKKFIETGLEVVIIDNWKDSYGDLPDEVKHKYLSRISLLKNTRILNVDICYQPAVFQIFKEEKPDVVIHLANCPIASVAHRNPSFALKQIVEGTLSLLEAAVTVNIERFVYISSSMVYGDFKHESIDENHPLLPKEIYGTFKLTAENLVKSFARSYGFSYTIVRPIAVYGPTGHEEFVITKFIRAAKASKVLYINGEETKLSFTYVDDTAHGIFKAATHPGGINDTFNIGSGSVNRLYDVAHYLKTLNPRLQIVLSEPNPLYPNRGNLDITKANNLLGFEPQYSIEEGLKIFYNEL